MLHYERLVRRGAELMSNGDTPEQLPPSFAKAQEIMQEMPNWGIAILIATLLGGLLLIASVRYTLQGVVATLAMVESNQTTIIVHDEKAKLASPDALAEEVIDSEVIVIKQIPITARIRTTMKHLRARAGFASRWRGLSILLVWAALYILLKGGITHLLGPLGLAGFNPQAYLLVAEPIAAVLSRVILARFGLTWTHIVISEPSSKSWFRRIPNRKAWKKIAGPTLFTAVAWQLSYLLPTAVALAIGPDYQTPDPTQPQETPRRTATRLIAVASIAIVTFIGITIPAEVALTRVQASMLPEEHESIVPFDRTFGGAVRPEVLGGSGKIGFVEAWATFNYGARARLLKLYAKIFIIEVALHFFVLLVLVAETFLIMGPKLAFLMANDNPTKFQLRVTMD